MAIVETDEVVQHDDREGLIGSDASREWASFRKSAYAVLKPVASLKLTVVLFALSIFIVLAGTFAQVDLDIWAVVGEYFRIDFARVSSADASLLERFREFFVWIDYEIFFPVSFFPEHPDFPGWMPQFVQDVWPRDPELPAWMGIWFPKGWTIGAVMLLNLFAAHLVRFRIQTKGPRLMLGLATIGLGCLVTALVVTSGSDADGIQSDTMISYGTLWRTMQAALIAMAGLSLIYLVNSESQQRSLRWLLGGTAVVLALAQVATMVVGPIDDSSMRILYQLIKGLLAGGVLLAGCIMVFKRRAGIVLLHGGIGLVMVYDVLVGTSHVESRMMIEEGEFVTYSDDIRTVELAIIDRSDPDQDWHTVIPASLLKEGEAITSDLLPFDVEILRYYPNADLRRRDSLTDKERAALTLPEATGIGEKWAVVPVRSTTGTDMDAAVDRPGAYLRLTERKTGRDLGVYLVDAGLSVHDTVTAADQDYELSLRFKRLYKPYRVKLLDVQKNDYVGTDDPRDYRSIVEITDADSGSHFKVPIWMNNPLRYAGETFYQSNYIGPGELGPASKELTVLQVVSNKGWMIPYVSCMIVAVGMLAQFALTLMRFLNRRFTALEQSALVRSPDEGGNGAPNTSIPDASSGRCGWARCGLRWLVPGLTVVAMLGLISAFARPRSTPESQFQVDAFGKLPILYQGRPQPLDSLATNTLLMISDKQSFKHDTTDEDEKSKPAIHWLLDVAARPELADEHQVFRIESLELQRMLGLERREGNRYSLNEFRKGYQETREEAAEAAEASEKKEQLTLIQRKLLELHRKVNIFTKIQTAFVDMSGAVPTPEELETDRQAAIEKMAQIRVLITDPEKSAAEMGLPLVVPTHLERDEDALAETNQGSWLPYPTATILARLNQLLGKPASPATVGLAKIFAAWRAEDVEEFNTAVAEYRELLASVTPEELAPPDSHTSVMLSKTDFEAYFNNLGPFNLASWLYVAAFVLVAFGWLVWTEGFNRAAFWMVLVTFLLHTLALAGRIYISGRPPVTNLYSSAVFIGWAAVLFGIILEAVYGRGIGNVLATVVGFLTLRIAHGLAMDGDTYAVLEAVLDTQFWLATHVVCVTLGYAATFVAGGLGFMYIARGLAMGAGSVVHSFMSNVPAEALERKLSDVEMERTLTRMNYGVLCFGLFFSFVGTVLGGLWADDSWGRFWGWDPKENGALIIVLWNALVLHARWDGMIKARGLAVLTVLGAIVVSWSWFGTNELGVGLHSYGFTEGRLMKLGLFCMASLAVAGIGCLPKSIWRMLAQTRPQEPPA